MDGPAGDAADEDKDSEVWRVSGERNPLWACRRMLSTKLPNSEPNSLFNNCFSFKSTQIN